MNLCLSSLLSHLIYCLQSTWVKSSTLSGAPTRSQLADATTQHQLIATNL